MELSRSQLTEYVHGVGALATEAQDKLAYALNWVWDYSGHDLSMVREAISEFVPQLVRQYGGAAGEISRDLWERIYLADTGIHDAGLAYGDDEDIGRMVDIDTRYELNRSEGMGDAERFAALVSAFQRATGRSVKNRARHTMRKNAETHGGSFARVPTGAHTCAFCLMLAGRGFVYGSEEAAGAFDQWHNDCDCVVVANHDPGGGRIQGYDPGDYEAMYRAARAEAGSGDTSQILSKMRQMYDLK